MLLHRYKAITFLRLALWPEKGIDTFVGVDRLSSALLNLTRRGLVDGRDGGEHAIALCQQIELFATRINLCTFDL